MNGMFESGELDEIQIDNERNQTEMSVEMQMIQSGCPFMDHTIINSSILHHLIIRGHAV